MGILHIYHKPIYLLHFYLRNFRFTERQQQHWKFVVIATYCCVPTRNIGIIWRRHQMETFSELLDLCAGNWLVTGEFPSQRPVTRSFDVSLICAWINDWVNNRDTGDLRRHRAHYYVNVMSWMRIKLLQWHTSWQSSNKGGWQPNQGGTGVKDATKPVSVPALGPRQWSVGLAFAG